MTTAPTIPLTPTLQEVQKASHYQLAYWWRFAPSPTTPEQRAVMDVAWQRFKSMGGFNPALSKRVGWGD